MREDWREKRHTRSCAEQRALSAAVAASGLASSSSFITSSGAPFTAAWCRGSFSSCVRGVRSSTVVLHVGRIAWGRGREVGEQQGQNGAAAAVIVARVGSAARLILRSGTFEVGVEQQLHHIERRALGGGVVQGKLSVLRSAVHGVAWQRTIHRGALHTLLDDAALQRQQQSGGRA